MPRPAAGSVTEMQLRQRISSGAPNNSVPSSTLSSLRLPPARPPSLLGRSSLALPGAIGLPCRRRGRPRGRPVAAQTTARALTKPSVFSLSSFPRRTHGQFSSVPANPTRALPHELMILGYPPGGCEIISACPPAILGGILLLAGRQCTHLLPPHCDNVTIQKKNTSPPRCPLSRSKSARQ